MSDFVHLHNHSDFSLLESSQSIESILNRAKDLSMHSIALTENRNLFSMISFYKEANNRRFSLIDEETSIIGIARYPQKKGYFVPLNEPENGFWFTIKPIEIKKFLKIEKEAFITSF